MSPALPPYRVRTATVVAHGWRSDGHGKRATSAAWRTVPAVGWRPGLGNEVTLRLPAKSAGSLQTKGLSVKSPT